MSESSRWQSTTLDRHPAATELRAALDAAMAAADPAEAVRRFVRIDGAVLSIAGQEYDLRAYRRVRLVGAGKAGAAMAAAVAGLLGERLSDGLVVIKDDGSEPTAPARVKLLKAGHPVPDQRGVGAARAMAELLAGSCEDDLVLVVLSGGASALLCLPDSRVPLDDLQLLTSRLLAAGAPITAINTVRKHVELLKGGGLARLSAPAQLICLVLSDVVGNPLDVIASGPTVADASTYRDALDVLTRYGLREQCPPTISTLLEDGAAGRRAETVKPGDVCLQRSRTVVVGSNRQALDALCAALEHAGIATRLISDAIEGEARDVGRMVVQLAQDLTAAERPHGRRLALIAGGETTVTIRGEGRGGRNQELALAAAAALAGTRGITLITLATDGGDGPTDAAGGVVDGNSAARAAVLGLSLEDALQNNDSYTLLTALGDALRPGASGTNVNDLLLMMLEADG